MMRRINTIMLAAFFSLLLTGAGYAQTPSSDEYKASMEGWEVNLDKAFEISQATGKPILANFTGSDWCGWCIRLKQAVFVTPEFKKWADENVVLLEVDFPRKFRLPENIAQQNANLQNAFKVRGYPTIWVFDMERDEESKQVNLQGLATTGYGPEVNAWIKDVETKMANSRAALEKNGQ